MKKFIKATAMMLCLAFTLSSCYTHTHIVGKGAQTGVTVSEKQWFALWGLVPMNKVDTNAMADKRDYTITTQHSFVDMVISAFTGVASIQVKTVSVQK